MELLKKIAGIVITGAVVLGVIIGAISWFQMPAEDRSAVLGTVWRALLWIGITLVLPWATYFVTTAVSRRESNAMAGLMVGAYTVLNALILAWLLDWSIHSTAAIVLTILGLLIALGYNLLVCDWIAERLT